MFLEVGRGFHPQMSYKHKARYLWNVFCSILSLSMDSFLCNVLPQHFIFVLLFVLWLTERTSSYSALEVQALSSAKKVYWNTMPGSSIWHQVLQGCLHTTYFHTEFRVLPLFLTISFVCLVDLELRLTAALHTTGKHSL